MKRKCDICSENTSEPVWVLYSNTGRVWMYHLSCLERHLENHKRVHKKVEEINAEAEGSPQLGTGGR